MRRLTQLLVALALLLAPADALAARLALVIGIDDYETLPPLDKAVGDARAMSRRLQELGFSVTAVLNPGRRNLSLAISAFRRSLKPGDTAFVHYSGHGVEIDGRNLLLPRDLPLPTIGAEDFLISEAIDLDDLMARVGESGATVRIFVIDACRNNPFAPKGVRGMGGAGGLAVTMPPPSGTFVLYSAGFRQTALDRLGPDDSAATSVYTRVLLQKLSVPGASISDIARGVRSEVAALADTVGHKQSPAYYDELNQDVVLLPEPEAAPAVEVAATAASEAFEAARSLDSIEAWQVFLKAYDKGFHADMARIALKELVARTIGPTRLSATPDDGLLASFRFPLKGRVEDWSIRFSFTTQCENDHHIVLTSPSGATVTLMNRGLHRCAGTSAEFFGGAEGPSGLAGVEAGGEWQLTMRDLDANAFTGSLDAVSLRLTVLSNGVLTEQTIDLDGLPAPIPSPL